MTTRIALHSRVVCLGSLGQMRPVLTAVCCGVAVLCGRDAQEMSQKSERTTSKKRAHSNRRRKGLQSLSMMTTVSQRTSEPCMPLVFARVMMGGGGGGGGGGVY
jgi:hypothetical protein